MTSIAWRNLTRERIRLAISVGGVALSVLLVVTMRGLYSGILEQATLYVGSVPADLWVAQAGSSGDFLRSISAVPRDRQRAIEATDGVRDASPILAAPLLFQRGDGDLDLFVVGVDRATGVGWPPRAVAGRRIPGAGQVVVDRALAKDTGLAVGERLDVGGRDLEVAGVVEGGNALVYHFAWADLEVVGRLVDRTDVVSYFLVRTEPGTSLRSVAAAIERRVPEVDVFPVPEFVERNERSLRHGFLPMLWVLVIISLAVGGAVIGLTTYTATVEKLREYAVLKAIGLGNRRIYAIVVQQSLVAGAAGLAAGTALSYAVAAVAESLVPVFVVRIGARDLVTTTAMAAAVAVVASLIPLRPIARLHPAEVFRV